jgi:hypothetical protein
MPLIYHSQLTSFVPDWREGGNSSSRSVKTIKNGCTLPCADRPMQKYSFLPDARGVPAEEATCRRRRDGRGRELTAPLGLYKGQIGRMASGSARGLRHGTIFETFLEGSAARRAARSRIHSLAHPTYSGRRDRRLDHAFAEYSTPRPNPWPVSTVRLTIGGQNSANKKAKKDCLVSRFGFDLWETRF